MKSTEIDEKYGIPAGLELLCRNLTETDYDRLNEENIALFKDRMLDIIGCIFGGAMLPEDTFLYPMLASWGGAEEAPVFAREKRLPLPAAVMLNCISARSNDFGSMSFRIFGENYASHFGETLLPMSLTLADCFGVSGRELIVNNIAAEDTVGRIFYTMPQKMPNDMKMTSGFAAALAGRYYKLDAAQIKAALSYAVLNATDPGNSYMEYCPDFKLHNGESARSGLMAALFAKNGWRGLRDPYYGRSGVIAQQISRTEALPEDYPRIFDDLGKVYYTETAFKRQPGGIPNTAVGLCGEAIHRQITEKYGRLDPAGIRKLRVFKTEGMYVDSYCQPFALRDQINALFCFRFAAASTLLHGYSSVAFWQTEYIQSHPELIALAENAEMESVPDRDGIERLGVTVEMTDGTVFTEEREYVKSMYSYPGRELLVNKFWDQFNYFGKLKKSTGEKIIELCGRVEELEDVRELTELLVLK